MSDVRFLILGDLFLSMSDALHWIHQYVWAYRKVFANRLCIIMKCRLFINRREFASAEKINFHALN